MPSFCDSRESKFVWKIENFSCLKGESFYSPTIRTTDWNVVITRNSSHIFVYLNNWTSYDLNYYCSFSFMDSNGTPIMSKESMIENGKGLVVDAFKFPNENKLFPNNTLRLECRLWKKQKDSPPMSIYVCTRMQPISRAMMKTTFFRDISKVKEDEFKFVEPIFNGHNLGIKVLIPHGGQISVQLTTELFGFNANFVVSLLDTLGEKIEMGRKNFKFVSLIRTCKFDINMSRNILLCYPNKYLLSGTKLKLIFDCTFTGQFCYDSKVLLESEIFHTCTTANSSTAAVSEAETNSNETDNVSDESEISQTSEPITAPQVLQKMLREGYLSDFTLKVGDRTFPAHKSVLGVRSKVFRAMFESEMKEMQDNCVDIKDFDGDTLRRMLEFIYSDKLDKGMGWTEASRLYAAADFYALETLKQGCSKILGESLCVPSALGVLALADLHQEHQLKSEALDVISLYDQDIIGTEAWIKFEEENPKLATETLRKLYVKKMRA